MSERIDERLTWLFINKIVNLSSTCGSVESAVF